MQIKTLLAATFMLGFTAANKYPCDSGYNHNRGDSCAHPGNYACSNNRKHLVRTTLHPLSLCQPCQMFTLDSFAKIYTQLYCNMGVWERQNTCAGFCVTTSDCGCNSKLDGK